MAEIVVVGSGVAGLTAALHLAENSDTRVTVVTKGSLSDSNTRYAQGGIAAAIFADDSPESHVADTLRAGAGLTVDDAVRVLCSEGPLAVQELIARGAVFDHDGDTLARGLEAAHSTARVLHAGGDATGAEIERTLVTAARETNIVTLENTELVDLIVANGCITGTVVRTGGGREEFLPADAVIIATGGWGQLYGRTTNPAIATGDGVAAAWRAGALVADLEFTQFHPTALVSQLAEHTGAFLISEAVRGEGAVLRDRDGHRFMVDVHPDAELAPRDVVARAIANQMTLQNGEPVVLDATALSAPFLAHRFPTIDHGVRVAGYDWSSEPIPVTPAAHYAMGGIATDSDGRTSLPGLYAAGEAACTGVHGANRLASNSLLEGLVFSRRAARAIQTDYARVERVFDAWPAPPDWCTGVPLEAGFDSTDSGNDPFSRTSLQEILWSAAGLSRNRDDLAQAHRKLAAFQMPSPGEDANLLQLGRLIVSAAAHRIESRGAHYRSDAPSSRRPLGTSASSIPGVHTVIAPSHTSISHALEVTTSC